ncbi:MAG: hypothetical protein FJ161_04130 [Gammaproteobacteria bacterium]|nr:hypothetical protein [Gammaproteobacteria bacterium]
MKNVYPEIAQAVLESEIIPTECIVAYLKYYGISLSEDYTKCYSWYDMAKPTEKYLLSVGDEVAHDMIYEQMTHILIHGGGRLMRLAPAVMISLASSGLIHGRKNQNPIAARFRDRLGKLFVSPHDLITSNIKTSQFSIEQFVAQHFAQFFVENLHDIFNKKDQYPTEFQRILEDVISAKVVPCFRLTFDPKIMAIDAIDIHLTWDRIAKVMQLPAPWIQMLCLQGGLFDPLNWARTQLYYGFGQKAPKNSAFDYWKLKRPHKHKEEKELLHPRSDCMLIIDEPIKQILEIEDECAILKRTANEYMKQIISKLQHQVSNTKFTYKKNILLTFPHCSYEELMEGLHACSINTRIKEQILNANQSRLHDVYAAFSKQNFSQISLVALFKYWESQPEVAKNWIERLERRLWSLLIEDVSADSSHLFAYLIEGFISADRPEVNPIANPLQKDRGSENHQHNGLIKPMGMRAEHSKIREGNLVKKPYKALTRAQQDWLDKLSDWPIEKYPRINMQLIVKLISYYHIKADVLIERLVRYSPSIPECSLSDFSAICEALTQTALFPICAELLERIAVELDLQHVSAFAPSPLIKRLTISSTASTLDLMLSIQESVFHYKTDAWPSKLKESLNHYQASYLKYALRFPFKLYNDTYFKGQNSHKNRMQRKLRGIQRRHFKSLIQVCYPAVQEMLDSYEKRYILGLLILSHASAGSIEMLLIRPEYRELLIAFNHKITHWLKIAKESSLTLSSEAQFLERYRIAMKKYYFHHYGDRSLLAHIGAEDYMRGLIAVVMHSQRPLSQKYELLRVLYHAGIATHCDFFIQGQQNKIFANSLSLKDSDLNISYEEFDSWCDVLVANSYAKCIKMAFSIFHTPRHVHFYDDFFSKRVVFLCTALTTRLSKETIEVLLNECAIRSADLRPLLLHPDIANQLDLYSLYITIKWCLKNTEPEYLAVEKDGIAKYLHTYLKRVRDDWPEDQSYTARRQMIKLFNWFFNDLKVEFIQPIPFFRWAQRKSVLPIVRWMVTHFKDVVIAQWTWFQYFRSYFFTEELPVRPRDFMQWILGKVDYMPYFSAWLREYSHDELTTPRDRETIAYNICRLTQLRHELMIPSELEGQQEFSQNDFHLLMRESSAIVYSEGAVGNIGTNVAKKRPSAKKK